jgi:hypothetical protein
MFARVRVQAGTPILARAAERDLSDSRPESNPPERKATGPACCETRCSPETRTALRALLRLCDLGELRERRWIIDRHVGEDLAIERDLGLLEAVHEHGVR